MREAQRVELATARRRRAARPSAFARALLAALWLVLIPLLCSALALRYLVPRAVLAPGFEGAFARLGRGHTLLLLVSFFLICSALIRYWRAFLPGGRYLSSLPPDLVERVPRRRTRSCEEASALVRWLESPRAKGSFHGLSSEQQLALAAARSALQEELNAGKWSRIPRTCARLKKLTAGAEARGSVATNLAFVASLGLAALLALALRATLFQAYEVNGSSMLPSLAGGDLLAGRVLSVRQAPPLLARGDVVVLRATVDGQEEELVKRVIGLPGDRIGMHGAHPVINGWAVPVCDAGAYYSPDDETASERGDPGGRVALEFLDDTVYLTYQAAPAFPFTEYVVKPRELFVLGDNRSNSRDSRAFDQGLPRGFAFGDVKAKVQRVLLSRTRSGQIDISSIGRRLGLALHLDGLDVTAIEAGIQRCLASRPTQTNPPKSNASQALASGAP
jgi:signal peptidase I